MTMKVLWGLIFFLISHPGFSYVFTKTNKGQIIKWPRTSINIYSHLNSSNSSINSNFNAILNTSVSQWNGSGNLSLNHVGNIASSGNEGVSEIYFQKILLFLPALELLPLPKLYLNKKAVEF